MGGILRRQALPRDKKDKKLLLFLKIVNAIFMHKKKIFLQFKICFVLEQIRIRQISHKKSINQLNQVMTPGHPLLPQSSFYDDDDAYLLLQINI